MRNDLDAETICWMLGEYLLAADWIRIDEDDHYPWQKPPRFGPKTLTQAFDAELRQSRVGV